MNDLVLELVSDYGLWLVGITTFLSCLAIPAPASLVMIASGAFAASNDLSLYLTATAAFTGAVAGDQSGFAIGRRGQAHVTQWGKENGRRGALFNKARDFMQKWGRTSVFLSRWLFSPLGPYVNFVAGANGVAWRVFTPAAAMGEVIWVALYIGLGFVFADSIEMVADFASNISGLLAAALMAGLLGRYLFRAPK